MAEIRLDRSYRNSGSFPAAGTRLSKPVQKDVLANRVGLAADFNPVLVVVPAFGRGRPTLPAVHPGLQRDSLELLKK